MSTLVLPSGIEPLRGAMSKRCLPIWPREHNVGAADWNRTSDTRIFSPLLYLLSYGYLVFGKGIEPSSDAFHAPVDHSTTRT